MTPIKVVIMLESLMHGGVQQGALLLAPRLDKSKYQVEVWALRNKKRFWRMAPEFEKAGIKIRAHPIDGFHDNAGIVRLARALATEKIVLLNTRSFYANILGRIAARLARTPAVIANYHHTYAHRWAPHYIAQEKMLRKGTRRFVCVSRAVERELASLLDWPRERVQTLYNGLDISTYEIRKSSAEIRRKLSLPPDAPLIANIGRLTEVKDLGIFLRAARIIADKRPEARFLIVGDGDQAEKIRDDAERLGLNPFMIFLGARNDVPEILHASDIVVSTSLMEGFPRIVLEAFSARRPVVTTPAGGVPEIVENGRNGIIIPFGDARACAESVLGLVDNRNEAARLADEGWKDVQKYSLKSWVDATDKMFHEVIAESTSKPGAKGLPPISSEPRMRTRLAVFRMQARARAFLMKAKLL